VATPGHAPDHLCYLLAGRRLAFSGDHVLGRGTTVVLWPEGDMAAYMHSLERVLTLDVDRLLPGHGPLVPDAHAKAREYLAHRREREAQVLAALHAGDATPGAVVARLYADVDPVLHPAAELSVRAHLDKLVAEGAVTGTGDGPFRPAG
jgi:glyoxylase-like metal-dependent hydrolase (beta-lactamase superfamily II)